MPKVSVIIPTFNRGNTIGRAIRSVINQTYSDLEIIVIDDHSNDATVEVVDAFADSRIRYFFNESNFGANKSRNRGITEACGEYIAFLDSDDEWRLNKLEKQFDCMSKYDTDICVCKVRRHGFPKGYPKIVPDVKEGILDRNTIIKSFVVATPGVLAKRRVLEEFRFDDSLKRWQDYDWSIRASSKYSVCCCDEVLVDLYVQNDGITQFDRNKLIDINLELQKKYENSYELYPGLKERLLNELIKDKALLNMRCDKEVSELLKTNRTAKYVIKYMLNYLDVLPLSYRMFYWLKRAIPRMKQIV